MLFVQNSENGVTKSRNPKDKLIMSLLIENIFIKKQKNSHGNCKITSDVVQ